MKKKDLSIEIKEFQKRFISVVETHDSKFWTQQLEVQANLLWGWRQGYLPSIEYILQVVKITGVSPTWLFLGKGPQHLHSDIKDTTPMPDDAREKLQSKIYTLEKQIKIEKQNCEKEIENIRNDIKMGEILKWLVSVFKTERPEQINPEDILSQIAMPVLSFLHDNLNTINSLLQEYAKSDQAKEFITNFVVLLSRIKKGEITK